MKVLETERLILRRLGAGDEAFMLELLNEPSFVRNIGDKGVRTLADAGRYLSNGPLASYERFGFGLYLVELRETAAAVASIGICGLVRRDTLPDVDIGFAFLPAYWSKGYAVESAAAVMTYARETLRLKRLLAITAPDNEGSIRVLQRIGFTFDRMMRLAGDNKEIRLFTSEV